MEPNKQQLKQLQGVCLELMQEIDRICRKNDIQYSLGGGTLIGAVREHGFIPWDDDADIAMTRPEYDRFVEACKRDLNKEKFFLQDHNSDPEYPWGYSKLRMNGTSIIQIGQEHLNFHKGIYIDIFIYDHVPDGFFSRRIHFVKCWLIRKCQYSVVGCKHGKTAFLRFIYSIMNKVPKKWLFKKLEQMAARNNAKQTELSRHMTFPYFKKACKYGLPTKSFEEYMDTVFEGVPLRIIRDYNTVLTLKYGDYMTPPPAKDITFVPISGIQFREENE